MTEIRFEIKGLDEIRNRMKAFPQKWRLTLNITLKQMLFKIWQNIPPYPSKPPNSTYVRTGTLGRSLGSNFAGGQSGGRPDIFERKLGDKFASAEFGTRLDYAPYVIGDPETEQAEVHRERWWNIVKFAQDVRPELVATAEAMVRGLARWLEGKEI